MKITTFTHLEGFESLITKTIEIASMIQPSNTSRRVLIRFPMLTLQIITDDLSSIMLHTGKAIIISAFERSKATRAKSLNATRFESVKFSP